MIVVCPKCGHSWDTSSTALWVTCPNCMRKSIREAMRVLSLGEAQDQKLATNHDQKVNRKEEP